MECPYCDNDLLGLSWKYWSGTGSGRFELICPECGNNVVVMARLSFDIHKHEQGEARSPEVLDTGKHQNDMTFIIDEGDISDEI